ncbi:MAG: hypothetical protein Kow00121_45320 [Elainellaceae cyanobacterium]
MTCDSEERPYALVQNISDIITIVSADDTIAYVSPSIRPILGQDVSSWLGRKLPDLVHSDDRNQTERLLHSVLATPDTNLVVELRFQHHQGDWHRFRVTAQNLLAQPKIQGIVITYHDITQQRQREERIRLLESVVVNANDSVIITEAEPINSPGPRIVYVNEAFTRETGYTLSEVIGKTPRILQGPKSDRTGLDRIRAALEQWQPIRVDVLNYRKDGSTFWAELSVVPVADETGWFTHWVAIQRDITQRKQVEEETRKALEQEKELRELKTRFVSMVSHEFRTPLATILASSDLLKSFGHKLSELQKQERLQKIQVEVKNMTQLLDEILLLGKAEAGRVEYKPRLLNLKQLCQDILDETQLWISDRHTLVFDYWGNSFQAMVDEKLLRHILTNLLSNAVKYSPMGGAIKFQLQCKPQKLIFQVHDNGIGIPEADLAKLYEPFHRASNVGNISGTGLGMAIVKHAVELHHGQVHVHSLVGSGSTFTVEIPRLKQ